MLGQQECCKVYKKQCPAGWAAPWQYKERLVKRVSDIEHWSPNGHCEAPFENYCHGRPGKKDAFCKIEGS